ncbi:MULTISPECIES: hypothetical protein [unclassified Moorena]|uniref:hypothetical protein n=1 Tax=unclassified Moorena TaxID=2683338 RepID=UPI001400D31B|nr:MULTISPECIES: hypothetical protein [unclassified Moorena]NEO11012.1 hypothetical protein [Moorena sp. SIO3E8]NEP99126.1 hypothetical protein [Moorena sp. SIO3F7]
MKCKHSAISSQPSALSRQLSAVSSQLSAISSQLLNKTSKHWFNLCYVSISSSVSHSRSVAIPVAWPTAFGLG